jgi:AraC family transcriptional regulator
MLGRECDTLVPIASVAALAGMSVFHFSRVFRAVFGQSPNRYRLEARIRFAQVSLVLGSTPITQIALDAGFASPSTFCRVFAQRSGCSPAQYRRQFRQAGASISQVERTLHPGCLSLMTRLPKLSTI